MTLRDVGFYLRGRVNTAVGRLRARAGVPPPPPQPLGDVLSGPDTPLPLTGLLEGRSNVERPAALARYLDSRGIPFARQAFTSLEGSGENLSVDLGGGDRVLILVAHHDAVPGSPGANDNAASVAILLALARRLERGVPAGLRVRLLFPACEEIGYLGARAYVRERGTAGIVGVVSLELCGVGDSVVVWDATEATPFLRGVESALRGLGRRADDSYHVVGRIPVFGSDHRAFAAAGVPAYGLTMVPAANADALRAFIFHPVRGAILNLVHRPAPFDTYHTSRDTSATLEPAALDTTVTVLESIVSATATTPHL